MKRFSFLLSMLLFSILLATFSCFPVQSMERQETPNGTDFSIWQSSDLETLGTNILVNPDFDLGPGYPWVEYSNGGYDIISSSSDLPSFILPLPSESYAAWLGGYPDSADYLYQDINIPQDVIALEIKGLVCIATEETTPFEYDHVNIEIRDSATHSLLETLETWSNLDNTPIWTNFVLNPTGNYNGQTICLFITATTDSTFYTSFFFDSLEVNIKKVDYELQLSVGWNMVSFPVMPDDPSFSSIFADAGFYQVLTWDGSSYVAPITAEAGVGYWVLVLEETTVSIKNAVPVSSYSLDLPAGWNMIGSIYQEIVNADDVFPGYYQLLTWDGTSYIPSTTIEPGKGYWALVLEPTTITVG